MLPYSATIIWPQVNNRRQSSSIQQQKVVIRFTGYGDTHYSAKNTLSSPSSHFCGDPVTKEKLMASFMLLQMDVGLSIEGKAHFPIYPKITGAHLLWINI